jgi:parallel beta-helix repeat protein
MKNITNNKELIVISLLLFLLFLTGCFLLPPQNHEPVINSNPNTDATIGQTYTYTVDATDPDGDPLNYKLTIAPDGMEVSADGIISWTPVDTGSYDVTLEVSDGKSNITQTFTIVVTESSSPSPSLPGPSSIEEEAKEILETQDLGREYFEQLESQDDPDALQQTIDYLEAQPNIDSVEVGEDGDSMWIKYKSGVEGAILTEPFRSLGDLSASEKAYSSSFVKESTRDSVDKKAIILLPFDHIEGYKDTSVDCLRNSLMQSGYSENSIEIYDGSQVTVDLMRTLGNYNFIYMSTHGSVDSNGLVGVATGEEVSPWSMSLIWESLTGHPKEISIVSVPAKFFGIEVPMVIFALNPSFFQDYTYQGSFVHMNACNSYKNSTLSDVFLYNGAEVYIGWDNTSFLELGKVHYPEFYEELAKQDNSVQQAYNSTFANYYPATVYKDTNNNKKWRIKLLNGEDLGDGADTTADYNLDLIVGGDDSFVLNPSITPETYTITASAESNGSIDPSGDILVDAGADQIFTITPDEYYQIADVVVDGSSVGVVDNYTFTNVNEDHTISATFSEETIPVVNHAPVIVSTPIATANIDEPYSYDVNATDADDDPLTYSLITNPEGMNINSSTGIITWVPSDTGDFDVTVKASDGDIFDTQEYTITVSPVVPDTFTITASAGSNGSIDPSGDVIVNEGSDQLFNITPDSGYEISDVLVDGSPIGAESTCIFTNITQDHTISATFNLIASNEIYVPDDYSTIQGAVDAAVSGDTIIVQDGTYIENVNVDKESLTIKSKNGAGSTFVQANNQDANVFDIRIDNININGFTVKGATGYINGEPGSGIYLQGANYCTLINNNIIDDRFGIFLKDSDNCNISDNTILEITTGCGIYLLDSLKNNIENNNSSNNHQGIFLERSNANEITGNTVNSSATGHGISLYSSDNNIVTKNTAIENSGSGISSSNSSVNNLIYLNNLQHGSSDNSNELWNSPEEMTYTYNGNIYTNYLGNYWEYHNLDDLDNNGIGDTYYNSLNEAKDNYPLMEPFENYNITLN